MSSTNILKSTFVIAIGAFVGYGSVKLFTQPNENNRGLASMTFSKMGSDQFAKTLFDAKIKNESVALSAVEVSTIKVSIESFKSFQSGLFYNWNLPENVELVEGSLSGDLQEFAANQTKELTIKVKGYSKETKNFISFTIKGNIADKKIERDLLVSSRPEDSFEYVVQEVEKAKAEEKMTIKKLGKAEVKSPIDLKKVSF